MRLRVGHRRAAAADHDRRPARLRRPRTARCCSSGATTCCARSTGDPDAVGPRHRRVRRLHRATPRGVIADRRAEPARRPDERARATPRSTATGSTTTSLVHESLLILIGGDETTRHVITGGAYQLLTDRDQWDAAARRPGRAARPRSRRCCAGCRRSRTWPAPPPATSSSAASRSRRAQKLLLLYPSANRDEDVFADPFRFDITPHAERPRGLRLRHPLLPRQQPRPARAHASCSSSCSTRLPDLELVDADRARLPPRQLRQRLRVDAGAFTPVPRSKLAR